MRRLPPSGIFDAENTVFSADGRLFCTGGANIYEITRPGGPNSTTPLHAEALAEPAYYLGMVVVSNWLVALRSEGPGCKSGRNSLVAAELMPGVAPVFTEVAEVTNASLSNGMALHAASRCIFITDTAPLQLLPAGGQVLRMCLRPGTPAPGVPPAFGPVFNWGANDTKHPNGLKIFNDTMFLATTESLPSRMYHVTVLPDGSRGAAKDEILRETWFDDLNLVFHPHRSLPLMPVADYSGGVILWYDVYAANPTIVWEMPLARDWLGLDRMNPSSVLQGQPPMFDRSELIITDKGIVCLSGAGDQLVVFSVNPPLSPQ